MRKWISDILYSFPLQLLLLHLRSNLLLIFTWIIMVLLMSGTLGNLFGIRYLFLNPEYLGTVGILSFFILGIGFGTFVMTWNLACYILVAHYFPFLASLQRPFTKFCLNNALLPIAFTLLYIYLTVTFKLKYMFSDWGSIFIHLLAFLAGMMIFILLAALYFYYTNKDIFSFLKIPKEEAEKILRPMAAGRQQRQMESLKKGVSRWRVDTYLNESLKPRLVRPVSHYDPEILNRVYKQNHVNALIVQVLGLMVLVALGLMIENPYFRIPAGTSVFILASIFLTITSAIIFWFQQWSLTVIVGLLLIINHISTFEKLNHHNKAYGLNYNTEKPKYDYDNLKKQLNPALLEADKNVTKDRLNNWRKKFPADKPPKMVIYCVSGGGMKATEWAMSVMQQTNIATNGKAFNQSALITGASGGMIGAAYLRELHLQALEDNTIDPDDAKYIEYVSQDILNSLAFTIVSNDLFLPWVKFEYNGKTYRKDRGYIFEKTLSENTHGILDKSLSDYRDPEQLGKIPALILTPYIVNDGRQLMISPHGVSYLTIAPVSQEVQSSFEMDAVDFGRFFEKQDGYDLRFTTGLRMSATYPYILPNVHMPSEPAIEVMDAGFRDNYGIGTATRFIQVFKDWILENTDGVVLVQVSSLDKIDAIDQDKEKSLFSSMLNPLGVAGQILSLQDYELDNNLGHMFDILGDDHFDLIRFIYSPSKENPRASVTFHLTEQEKKDILEAINNDVNQESLRRLRSVFLD